MTLESYNPDDLDELSLRLMDICARLRIMARKSRVEQLPPIALHDRKALEWVTKLEEWLDRVEPDFEHELIKNRGKRLARRTQAGRGK
jgi:hypothetical protein